MPAAKASPRRQPAVVVQAARTSEEVAVAESLYNTMLSHNVGRGLVKGPDIYQTCWRAIHHHHPHTYTDVIMEENSDNSPLSSEASSTSTATCVCVCVRDVARAPVDGRVRKRESVPGRSGSCACVFGNPLCVCLVLRGGSWIEAGARGWQAGAGRGTEKGERRSAREESSGGRVQHVCVCEEERQRGR